MASIKNTPGTLSPPACYASEQERFEAYVAKIISTIIGGLQWESGNASPVDLGLYWLRLNSDTRPRGPRHYSAADGRWIPWLEIPLIPDSSGGAADAYTVTTGHNLVTSAVQITGRRVLFTAIATNTGASTLAVDGTAAVQIVRHNATPLAAGDIISGTVLEVVYNTAGGGRWELQTPVPPPADTTPTFEVLEAAAPPGAGSSVTLSHSGTSVPEVVDVRLVCTAADRGYSIDDEVSLGSFFWSGSNTGIPAFTVAITDNQVIVIRSSSASVVYLCPKGGGSAYDTPADMAKWSLRASCIFFP